MRKTGCNEKMQEKDTARRRRGGENRARNIAPKNEEIRRNAVDYWLKHPEKNNTEVARYLREALHETRSVDRLRHIIADDLNELRDA